MSAAPTPLDEADIAYAGVLGQAELLRSGRLTSVDLVDVLLARIARLDGRIRAFRIVLAEAARAAAAEADRARQAGDTRPLLGVPIAIKDNLAVAGQAALLGTGSPEPIAANDAELTERLRAAGLIIIGLTHLPELALWAATESKTHGISRNPWDRRRTPGGSSGGSAAAVAAGMVAGAHATDGLGSIRIPSSCCGLVGLKPTHGLVPAGDHWNGLSHAGFVTRSVADTAALLDAATLGVVGLAAAAATPPPVPLTVAISLQAATPARPVVEVRRVVERAATILRELGHHVVERDAAFRPSLGVSNTVRYLSGLAEDVAGLTDPQATERRTRTLAALGARLPARAVPWARATGAEFAASMAEFFETVDVLVMPTMPVLPRLAGCLAERGTARTIAHMLPCAAYTGPWNASGLPALNVPVGTTAGGLPVGVQLVGPAGADGKLLSLAASMEPVAGWLDRRVAE